ncbi:MAG: TetR/AcrR family transcriptional regulator [Alphaproteobacteria bacterium]|nr:TetR/AcrR family transcriptional regulator [Alphaproteobacteria bacterium]MCB9794350.1 TetR/AcrR family transcriptional regulator [Alphaproteobacteria bacterium]
MPGRRKPRDRYHHGNLREALIEAAALVAAERGVDAIQVKELAKATGVSVAAPFKHFPTRLDLLVAAAEEGARRQRARAEAASEGLHDPLDQLQAQAVAYVRWAVEERGYFRLLSRPELLEASPTLQAMNAQSRALMERAMQPLREGVQQGAPRGPLLSDRAAGSLAARALVYGLARMLVDGHLGEVEPEQAARLAHQLTEVLGQGLAGLQGAAEGPQST